jgi:hypothetical protein
VSTGVVQILTLQPNAWATIIAAVMGGQSFRFIEGGGTTHVVFEEMV